MERDVSCERYQLDLGSLPLAHRLGSLPEGSPRAGRPDYCLQRETCHEQQSDLQRTQRRLSIHTQCFLDLLGRGGRLLHRAPQLVVVDASDVVEIDLHLDFLRQQRIRGHLASELNGSPVAFAPSLSHASSGSIVSQTSTKTNGFDTLTIENSWSMSSAP
jgi:hypothetical protein